MLRGSFVFLDVPETGLLLGRSNGETLLEGRSWLGGFLLFLGPIVFWLSCRGPTGVETGVAIGGWLVLGRGLGLLVLLPGMSMLMIGGGLLCRMRWLLSGVVRPWRSRSPIGGGTRLRRLPRRRRWRLVLLNIPRR
jgi:hypothetical protein